MKLKPIHILCLFISLTQISCADSLRNEVIDYCSTGDYQNCDANNDAGDCIEAAGCKHPVSASQDVYLGEFKGNEGIKNVGFSDGYVGRIDSGCRSLRKDAFGGDVDWIAVKTKPGKPLTVKAKRPISAKTKPILYLHNRAGGELIYSTPDEYGNSSLSFLAPDELFYISVEEMENYNYDYQPKCEDSNLSGGEDYLYVLKVSKADLEIEDLGLVRSKTITKSKFTDVGQSHYYNVSVPLGAKLGVTLKTTSPDKTDAQPVLSPLSSKTKYEGGSEYSWIYAGDTLKSHTSYEGYISVFQDEIQNDYAVCNTMECKFLVAVSDYSSIYDYEYELTVEAISH